MHVTISPGEVSLFDACPVVVGDEVAVTVRGEWNIMAMVEKERERERERS